MHRTELTYPPHFPDQQLDAIETYRQRLDQALERQDRQATIGAAKELLESVARSILHITGRALGGNADFSKVVGEAQDALHRDPGKLGNQPEVRAIAQAARTIAINLTLVRNSVGTGHGRAIIPDIDEAMLAVAVDAALLWSRWAMLTLEPLLKGATITLITAVHSATQRKQLQELFDASRMSDRSPEDQKAIGIAFGQRAGGGFNNAWVVGLKPVLDDARLELWPAPYRLGLIEGLTIDQLGEIHLSQWAAPYLVNLAEPVAAAELTETLRQLAEKIAGSTWSATVDRKAATEKLRTAAEDSDDSEVYTELLAVLTASIPKL